MTPDNQSLLWIIATGSGLGAAISLLGLIINGIVQEKREQRRSAQQLKHDETRRRRASQIKVAEELQRLIAELESASAFMALARTARRAPTDDEYEAVRVAVTETVNWATRLENEAFGDLVIYWAAIAVEDFAGEKMFGQDNEVLRAAFQVVTEARGTINLYLSHIWRDAHLDRDVARALPDALVPETFARKLLTIYPAFDEAWVTAALKHVVVRPMPETSPPIAEKRLRLPSLFKSKP